ncbi:MAG: glycine oxidase ThiO [Actinomycetes bacterium]
MGIGSLKCTIIGAGITGLATAWRLSAAGHQVSLIDPQEGPATSTVAAGMLGPTAEHAPGEDLLTSLLLVASQRWKLFAQDLELETQLAIGLRESGTIMLGFDADDRRALERSAAFNISSGLKLEALKAPEIALRLANLAPAVTSGYFLPGDHQVDPRAVMTALTKACADSGVEQHRARALRIEGSAVILDDGRTITGDRIVLATGAGARGLVSEHAACLDAVRPVKGITLRLRDHGASMVETTIRGLVEGRASYIVPRSDGEIVIGASSLERGFDARAEAGSIADLLGDARKLFPVLDEASFEGFDVGFRPATADHAPIVGRLGQAPIFAALGSYRNGILLAPLIAEAITQEIGDGLPHESFAAFPTGRFG